MNGMEESLGRRPPRTEQEGRTFSGSEIRIVELYRRLAEGPTKVPLITYFLNT